MKSKLASGPHESKKDPQEQPQEEITADPLAEGHAGLRPGGQNLACYAPVGNSGRSESRSHLSEFIFSLSPCHKVPRCFLSMGGNVELTRLVPRFQQHHPPGPRGPPPRVQLPRYDVYTRLLAIAITNSQGGASPGTQSAQPPQEERKAGV